MIERADPLDTDTSVNVQPSALVGSAGFMLRAAREAAGMHIAALAVSLKVPVKKLEALEADRLDLLPDAVFARALAASVCRTLKVDCGPVLEKLPQTVVPRLTREAAAINTPFRLPGEGRSLNVLRHLSKPAAGLVLGLLLGAVLLMFMPPVDWFSNVSEPASAGSVVETPSPSAVQGATAPVLETGTGAAQRPASSAVALNFSSSLGSVSDSQVAAASSPAMAALASPAAPSASVSAPDGLVVIKAHGDSWVQVTDANKVVQLNKTLAAGESAAVNGAVPLSVVVGRADAVGIQVRGKAVDLQALARENVARFEVK